MRPSSDPGVTIDALRERGADRFDPVGFRFIEALARRTAAHRGDARRVLDGKLNQALTDYGARFDQAEDRAEETLARAAERFPEAADALRGIYSAGDFKGLSRLVGQLESRSDRSPLADLVDSIAAQAAEDADGPHADHASAKDGSPAELKSLRYFRNSWEKLSADQALSQALAHGPTNAGPLNSHHLVLQSLALMHQLSPDYLKRFMAYVNALLWLDQTDGGSAPLPKEAVRVKSDQKRKSARGKSG